jgi:hypothetical protein
MMRLVNWSISVCFSVSIRCSAATSLRSFWICSSRSVSRLTYAGCVADRRSATTSAADSLAIPITHRSVNKTTGGDAEALSLADGAFLGQRLNINLVVDGGGDGTLTPTTASGFATIVFADAGDFAELEWTTAGWRIVGIGGLTAQPAYTL